MTFLFCDVRGFAMISELYRDDPQGLTRLMNRFMTPLTNAIVEHGGTVDKYMGDAVMAFWNAPLDDADHAIHACQAALAMVASLEPLNRALEAEARDTGEVFLPLRVGIGINTGTCVVGNLGSDLRFDYSVLGDSVNLASRIEGQTKTYGLSIAIGSRTTAAVAGAFALLEIDLIRVKGRAEPDVIHALLHDGARVRESAFAALTEINQAMLGRFRARDWTGALDALAACRDLRTDLGLDEFYSMYEARIGRFQTDPPPDDWDGIFEAEFK
jgi:adenylate cyclase